MMRFKSGDKVRVLSPEELRATDGPARDGYGIGESVIREMSERAYCTVKLAGAYSCTLKESPYTLSWHYSMMMPYLKEDAEELAAPDPDTLFSGLFGTKGEPE